MARYNSQTDPFIQETFQKDTGLPGSALPEGQGYIMRPGGMIDVPQGGGRTDTYYPSTTGGQLDLFSRSVPTAQDDKVNQEEEISQRMDAYKAMSIAELHKDLANAGFVADEKGKMQDGDPILQQLAYQEHIIRTSKITAWNQKLQDNFNIIKKEEKLTPNEKQVLRNKLLAESDDPIHIPTIGKRESVFTPAYVQKNLGEITANLNTGKYLDRSEAINDLISKFGPDAESQLPGVVKQIDSKFTTVSTVAKTSLPAVAKVVRIQAEDGKIWNVPSDKVDEAIKRTKGKRI
jgi:hypothetical protein